MRMVTYLKRPTRGSNHKENTKRMVMLYYNGDIEGHSKVQRPKNILKMNKEVGMLLPKKELIQVE